MIIAQTERLIISKVTIEDAPFFLELMNTPNWLKYIGDRNIKSIKDAEENIKNGHLKKIVAITNSDNLKSIKLLEKLGLVFEKKILLRKTKNFCYLQKLYKPLSF